MKSKRKEQDKAKSAKTGLFLSALKQIKHSDGGDSQQQHVIKNKTKQAQKHQKPTENRKKKRTFTDQETHATEGMRMNNSVSSSSSKHPRLYKKARNEPAKHQQGNQDQKHPTSPNNTQLPAAPPLINQIVKKKYAPLKLPPLNFDYKYTLAPMVGASELPFRLLCRKYGAQTCYTPMMMASKFVSDKDYRTEIFQTTPLDRPLVCHFGCNSPEDFANCVKLVREQGLCDACDINLGCPQRTAYVGHFGSYLLDPNDRELILDMVRAGAEAVSPPMPIFVKIRLLNTLQETTELCQQLVIAGASLIAIHARYRASWERTAAGARDGPAMLDQIEEIKKVVTEIPIIANGNVITYEDVENNRKSTRADGIMSAEGILDNPALFLPRLGDESEGNKLVPVVDALEAVVDSSSETNPDSANPDKKLEKKKRKLLKKLRKIEKIQAKVEKEGEASIDEDQRTQLASKDKLIEESLRIMKETKPHKAPGNLASVSNNQEIPPSKKVPLSQLYESANDATKLAKEYLALAQKYGPTTMRTIIFHTRRILKTELNKYQLMEDCLQCQDEAQVLKVIEQCEKYRDNPELFSYDREKAKQQKEALERKQREEGKRKAYEARMIRKAKREGRRLDYYLQVGAEVPTVETVARLKPLPKEQQLETWKRDHGQHCLAYHLGKDGCARGRTCAFLHVDAVGSNRENTTFDESEEVAG